MNLPLHYHRVRVLDDKLTGRNFPLSLIIYHEEISFGHLHQAYGLESMAGTVFQNTGVLLSMQVSLE